MAFYSIKAGFIHFFYTKFLKFFFFLFDPEEVHDRMTKNGILLGRFFITRKLTSALFEYQNPILTQEILGIKFSNPIGLAAGFDKDARLTNILPAVGFGFAEVGSITGEPCEGNPKPRLWRLPKQKSLVIYYGLKNEGCEKIYQRLSKEKFEIPVGISVAKTNSPSTVGRKAGIADYIKAYRTMLPIGSYTTVNVSCPNAFGGLPFTSPESLDELLTEIDKIPTKKPIFLKFPPDLVYTELDSLLVVSQKHMVSGYICSNLTKDRNNAKLSGVKLPEYGGISGKILEDLSNDQVSYVYKKTEGRSVIIGLGGVFNAKDAYKKIRLGANLVQLITGMIFEGPQVVGQINHGLAELLENDGFSNISQAVGVDSR